MRIVRKRSFKNPTITIAIILVSNLLRIFIRFFRCSRPLQSARQIRMYTAGARFSSIRVRPVCSQLRVSRFVKKTSPLWGTASVPLGDCEPRRNARDGVACSLTRNFGRQAVVLLPGIEELEAFEKATRSPSAPISQLVSGLSADAQDMLSHSRPLPRPPDTRCRSAARRHPRQLRPARP